VISYNFAKAFAIGVVLFWNFTANRLWTYRGL
jgi:putative flippase GtrA